MVKLSLHSGETLYSRAAHKRSLVGIAKALISRKKNRAAELSKRRDTQR